MKRAETYDVPGLFILFLIPHSNVIIMTLPFYVLSTSQCIAYLKTNNRDWDRNPVTKFSIKIFPNHDCLLFNDGPINTLCITYVSLSTILMLQRNPVTRILVALPRSWKNMETHGRLTKTHGKT